MYYFIFLSSSSELQYPHSFMCLIFFRFTSTTLIIFIFYILYSLQDQNAMHCTLVNRFHLPCLEVRLLQSSFFRDRYYLFFSYLKSQIDFRCFALTNSCTFFAIQKLTNMITQKKLIKSTCGKERKLVIVFFIMFPFFGCFISPEIIIWVSDISAL